MAVYWLQGNDSYYSLIKEDPSEGGMEDEIGAIKKKRNPQYEYYVAYAFIGRGEGHTFRYLTDAKRYVEKEMLGRYITKKRMGNEKMHPFGL